jgi:hypothetical protein
MNKLKFKNMKKSILLGLTLGLLFSCSKDLDETETVAAETLVIETETLNSGILDDPAFKSFELDGEVITDRTLIEESYVNSHYVEENLIEEKVVMYSTQEEFNNFLKANPEIVRRIEQAKINADAGITPYSGGAITNGEVPSLTKEETFLVGESDSRTLSTSQINAMAASELFHDELHYVYSIENSSTSGRTFTFDLYSNTDLTAGGIGANKVTASNTSTTIGTTTMNMNIGFNYIFNNSKAKIHVTNDTNKNTYYVYSCQNTNYGGTWKSIVLSKNQYRELTRSNFGPSNAPPKSILAFGF